MKLNGWRMIGWIVTLASSVNDSVKFPLFLALSSELYLLVGSLTRITYYFWANKKINIFLSDLRDYFEKARFL